MADQSISGFMMMAQAARPFAAGILHRPRTGMEGVPFMDNPIGQMVAAPYVSNLMASHGMLPFGMGHDQNIYDVYRKIQFTRMQNEAIQQAAQLDRTNYFNTMRGLAAITGTPFGAQQRYAAHSIADFATMVSPFAAQMAPDFLDAMGGSRGSAAVFASRAFDAARYRIDPVSGRMGMSPDSMTAATRSMVDDLYTRQGLRNMNGFTMGQAGSLFQELQARGMIATSAASATLPGFVPGDQRADVARSLMQLRLTGQTSALDLIQSRTGIDVNAGVMGLKPGELDKLLADPGVTAQLRSFDTTRVKTAITGYTKAIAAMRDIFGDAGNPNAPMSQLMQALDTLTSNSMTQLNPDKIASIARTTYNLAKQTGVTLDNALNLQMHAGHIANQVGLEPVFGVNAAQGALAFGGAYRAQGHAASPAWGMLDATGMQQLDANLRIQAAGSTAANRLAVLMRLRDSGGLREGSEAAKLAAALANGSDVYGGGKSVIMGDNEYFRMLGDVGYSESAVRQLMRQSHTNREYTFKYELDNVVRRRQGVDEVYGFAGDSIANTVYSQLIGRGVDRNEAARLSRLAGKSLTERFAGMATEERHDPLMRQRLAGDTFQRILGNNPLAGDQQFLRTTVDMAYGQLSEDLKTSAFSNYENANIMFAANSSTVLAEAERQRTQARVTNRVQEALAPLGRGSLLSRAVDAVQNLREGDTDGFKRAIASALGGVAIKDINAALQAPMAELHQRKQTIEDIRNQIGATTDPARRAELERALDLQIIELNKQTQSLVDLGNANGLFADSVLTPDDFNHIRRSSREITRMRDDLHGVRYGLGDTVTQAQLDAAKRDPANSGKTDDELRKIILAERRQLPGAPTKPMLDELRKIYGNNATDDQINDIAASRLRARRLGIDVAGDLNADPAKEIATLNALFAKQAAAFSEDENSLRARDARFAGFWLGDGREFMHQTKTFLGDAENIAEELLRSSKFTQQVGTRSIAISRRMTDDMGQLNELAQRHAGGSIARLLAGDHRGGPAVTNKVTELMRAFTKNVDAAKDLTTGGTDHERITGKQIVHGMLSNLHASNAITKEELDKYTALYAETGSIDKLPATIQREILRARDDVTATADVAFMAGVDPSVVSGDNKYHERVKAGMRFQAIKRRSKEEQALLKQYSEGRIPASLLSADYIRIASLMQGDDRLAGTAAEIKDALRFGDDIEQTRKADYDRLMQSPAAKLRSLQAAMGISPFDERNASPEQRELMAVLNTSGGRMFADSLTRNKSVLDRYAKAYNGDTRSLLAAYDEALQSNDPNKLAEFKKAIGITGDSDMTELERAVEFGKNQKRLFDVPKGKISDASLLDAFKDFSFGADRATDGGDKGPVAIKGHLTGTFRIEGDRVVMSAVAGDSSNFTAGA